jgi:hypothetical protein
LSAVTALDWRQIRTWKGSQDAAFEELCCQLARAEKDDIPSEAVFERRGAPDAGVECLWRLVSGDEWGWQAKFVTESPRAKHWSEIDNSVHAALERNHKISRYTICIPTLLPDDKRRGRKSAREAWNEHVAKWKEWCAQQHRHVEFVLWDESRLLEVLAKPAHAGRRAFWFGGPAFTAEWFAEHGVRPAVRQAHTRYTPPLHVAVPLQQTFEALTGSSVFYARLRAEGEHVRRILEDTLSFITGSADDSTQTTLSRAAERFARNIGSWPTSIRAEFDIVATRRSAAKLQQAATSAEQNARSDSRSSKDDRGFVVSQLRDLQRAVRSLQELLSSIALTAAVTGRLLVNGDAGSGKTHLFCAIAEEQLRRKCPVVLLLGEQFHPSAEPWTQIQQQLGLAMTRDEFLGVLDAAAEAVDCRALILIDAVNEGAGVGIGGGT